MGANFSEDTNASLFVKLSIALTGTALFWGVTATATKAASIVFVSPSSGGVGTVNNSTANFTQVASGPTFTDIAVSNEAQLFGITFSQLFNINLSSGTSSVIGNLGSTLNGLGFSQDNVLYGTGGSNFFKVNTLTGAAQLISSIWGFNSSGDIVFDPKTGRFLASSIGDSLWSIDPNSGSANKIGNINFSDVYGLFFERGSLYGYTANGQEIAINQQTGAGTFNRNVTGLPGQVWGSASLPSGESIPSEPVPEPTSIVGSILGLSAFKWALNRGYLQQKK